MLYIKEIVFYQQHVIKSVLYFTAVQTRHELDVAWEMGLDLETYSNLNMWSCRV